MARSESLASLCQPLWEFRAGLRSELPPWTSRIEPDLFASPLVERIIQRLGEFAARWHALPAGGSITLTCRVADRATLTAKPAGSRAAACA